MMLAVATAIFLWLLPSQVNGLITTDAKCLSGYDWMFSSIRQSPCDVAGELAGACVGGQFNLFPLEPGFVYVGPTPTGQSTCRCSSVFYSLLSACAYCQGRDSLKWTLYSTNCSTVYLTVYPGNIPDGVKVPAYAYQNVSISDTFDIAVARSTTGVESSRPPQVHSSTTTRPTSTATDTQSSSTKASTVNNTPAIVGGVVGGLVALGLIAALIIFLVLRSRQKSQQYNSSFNPSLIQSLSPPPGSPGRVYNADDRSSNINDPNQPLSQNVAANITGSSNHAPQTRQVTGSSNHAPQTRQLQYSGMPEL